MLAFTFSCTESTSTFSLMVCLLSSPLRCALSLSLTLSLTLSLFHKVNIFILVFQLKSI